MAPTFSEADDEILVEDVANHPLLWELSHFFDECAPQNEQNCNKFNNYITQRSVICMQSKQRILFFHSDQS